LADISYDERRTRVETAIRAARGGEDFDGYVAELFEDRAIFSVYVGDAAGQWFEYPYTLDDDDQVSLGDPVEVQREVSYAAVKFVGKDLIEGLAIPFGGTFDGRDLHGEAFDPETDLCIDWFGKSGRPILYDHGLDAAVKTAVIGRQVDFETRDEGVWAQAQLDLNAKYRKAVDTLIDRRALGFSSGAMPHLATKNQATGILQRWPWVELSLTPIPAEPSTLGVHYMKSAAAALELLEQADVSIPVPLKAAVAALDEWAESRGSDSTLDTATLDEKAGRVTAVVTDLRDHARAYAEMRAKSGRVLSASTRERLVRHPASLRELADDLDALLSEADSGKTAKSLDAGDLHLETDRILSRLLGVPVPEVTH